MLREGWACPAREACLATSDWLQSAQGMSSPVVRQVWVTWKPSGGRGGRGEKKVSAGRSKDGGCCCLGYPGSSQGMVVGTGGLELQLFHHVAGL